MKYIYVALLEKLEEKKPCALATIVAVEGSAPQGPGTSALLSPRGLLWGTLGGGVLERDAVRKAARAIRNREVLFYSFSLDEGKRGEESSLCGGRVKILIDGHPEKNRQAFFSLCRSLEKRRAGVLVTLCSRRLRGWDITRFWVAEKGRKRLPRAFSFLKKSLQDTFAQGRIQLLEEETRSILWEPLNPSPRLLIAGAGHIGQALARLAGRLGFHVTVVDDRREYARAAQLAGADRILVSDMGRAIRRFPLADDAYVVIATRGHRADAEALRACIRRPCAYIGMVGSRRKIQLMREEFLKNEWATESEWDRVHAPIGLSIGSETVEEIAVSIAAELIQVRRENRERKGTLR